MKKLAFSFIEKQTLSYEDQGKIRGGDCNTQNHGSGDCKSANHGTGDCQTYNWGAGDCLSTNYGSGDCGSNAVKQELSIY